MSRSSCCGLSTSTSTLELLCPLKIDFILYQYVFMAMPTATKKPIIADIIALPEAGSMYAIAGSEREISVNATKKCAIFNGLFPEVLSLGYKLKFH